MRTLVATAILLVSVATHAAELKLVSGGEHLTAGTARLRAERVDGAAEPIERLVEVPGAVLVPLGEGLWRVGIDADGAWVAPALIRDPDLTEMRVWPASVLTVQSDVKSLRAQFTALKADGPAGEVDCPRENDSLFRCLVPVGRHDVRFLSPGYAPEYRFGMQVARENRSELRLRFVLGASLSGTVSTMDGIESPVRGVEVSLAARGAGQPHTVTTLNDKGFFQFKGLSAGDYTLRAKKDRLVTEPRSVTIIGGAVAELKSPLLLDRPKRLTVSLMPARDPESNPWRVTLDTVDDVVSESAAAPDGQWSLSGLVAGEYIVRVRSNSGELWKTVPVTITSEDVVLPLAMMGERVTGRITLGDRPLEASLAIGGEGGPVLKSGTDGRFSGEIPAGDDEKVILVEADNPFVRRLVRAKIEKSDRGRELLIELPSTTIMGRVVNEDGSPAAHAILTITRDTPPTFEQAFAEADGSFQVAGLDSGDYRLIAETFEHQSDYVTVELSTDQPAEVELRMRREVVVRGRITMDSTPIIQAVINARPRDAWSAAGAPALSNARGEFVLRLPPGTTIYDVFATHPAFDVVLARATVKKGKILHIRSRQIGGTLIVESEKPQQLRLKHEGGEYELFWAAKEAGGTVAPERVTVPRLEAGEYAVCSLDNSQCVSGYVPAHGALTLSLK